VGICPHAPKHLDTSTSPAEEGMHLHVVTVGSTIGFIYRCMGHGPGAHTALRLQHCYSHSGARMHPALHRSTPKAASLWVGTSAHTEADETAQ